MLHKKLPLLSSKRIILASTSPRRKEILEALGLTFEVFGSTFEENLDKKQFPTPADYVMTNARYKALDVFEKKKNDKENAPFLIIASDTVVVLSNEILEKPKSRENAIEMLSKLSGSEHEVFSGVSLFLLKDGNQEPIEKTFFDRTEVSFANLTQEDIECYVNTGEPMDKAGSYGIQGVGRSFVKGIKGSFDNVMGFPSHRFSIELLSMLEIVEKE